MEISLKNDRKWDYFEKATHRMISNTCHDNEQTKCYHLLTSGDKMEIRAFAISKIHNNLETMKHDNLKPGRVGERVGKNERTGR